MIAVLPVAICFITALCSWLLNSHLKAQRLLASFGSFAVLVSSVFIFWKVWQLGPLTLAFGNWQPPFGITFRVDLLGAALLIVSSLIYFSGVLVSIASLNLRVELRGYYPLFHFLILGVLGAFSTGDLFNLYVCFEILLMSSFFLASLIKSKNALQGSFKYAVLSVISSFIFLGGIALIYSGTGTLNLNQLSGVSISVSDSAFPVGLGLLSFAFMIKAGLFPFYFWLPASYPYVVTPMAAVFSGLLTKVGLYGLVRVLAPHLSIIDSSLPFLIQALALISMLLGVLGAISQDNMKSILSFHIISQVGYIALALALGTGLGLAACIYYLLHHMVVKTNLFFVVSYIESNEKRNQISKIGGLLERDPLLALLFAIPALSLAGVPPLSGFWAKVFALRALLESREVLGVLFSLAVSLLTMMSMLKIWLGAFLKPSPHYHNNPKPTRWRWFVVPIILLNLWTVTMGLYADQVFEVVQKISLDLRPGEKTP
ncbi:complex I subunit 5 family protein [Bdellovibrio sp. HCB117]|uniref:complex I subunit 5 family protein n=1 Tax=Bdellovibrio sp. HCB117 TaxID=3394359 RepID=UPI0039B55E51